MYSRIPTSDLRFDPNGSVLAVEGITSPDGRVLGKMGTPNASARICTKTSQAAVTAICLNRQSGISAGTEESINQKVPFRGLFRIAKLRSIGYNTMQGRMSLRRVSEGSAENQKGKSTDDLYRIVICTSSRTALTACSRNCRQRNKSRENKSNHGLIYDRRA